MIYDDSREMNGASTVRGAGYITRPDETIPDDDESPIAIGAICRDCERVLDDPPGYARACADCGATEEDGR